MPFTPGSHLCIALIGDVVKSRSIGQRAEAQEEMQSLLAHLNTSYGDDVLAPFSLSRGDEIQALLVRADILSDVLWQFAFRFPYSPVRFGFGLGTLVTPLAPTPMETDGPAWWTARDALENARSTRRNGGVWRGFGDDDLVLTSMGTLLAYIRGRLTPRQRDVVQLLRAGADMVETANALGISKQAVHGIVRAAGWRAYEEGDAAWRTLLSRYNYGEEWKRAWN